MNTLLNIIYKHWFQYPTIMQLLLHAYNEYVFNHTHYNGVIMRAMASQVAGASNVCFTVGSGADQRKHQRTFVWGIHRSPVNSLHKGPITKKMFPFDDIIIWQPHLEKVLLLFYKLIQRSICKVIPNINCFGSKTPVLHETHAYMFQI